MSLPTDFGQLVVLLQPLIQNRDVQREIADRVMTKPVTDREWYDLAKKVMDLFPPHIERRIYNRLWRRNLYDKNIYTNLCFVCNNEIDHTDSFIMDCPICLHGICNYCYLGKRDRYDYYKCEKCEKGERRPECDMEGCVDHLINH